jgi:predicted DNA-binding transcriptional regulator YafY
MSEIDRLYSYRILLSERKAISRDEILSKLEISPATFKRDLSKLRDRLNIPVVFDRDLGGYRIEKTDARHELPGLWFSQDEILALLTIQNMLVQLEPGLLGPKLKPLQKRLDEIITGQGINAEMLSQRVRVVHAGKRNLKLKCFEQIVHSTLHRKQINIKHFNRQSGKTVQRVISPQQLVHYRDNWYVDAWCHMRKEVRSFAVDAITECEQLSLEAKELDSELFRNLMQGGYGIFGGVVKNWAKLKFTPERTRWVKHEEWHPDQVGAIQNDGSYVLEIPYSDERELIGDLLKHGSSVEVLSPLDLRKKVKDEIQKAIRVYE